MEPPYELLGAGLGGAISVLGLAALFRKPLAARIAGAGEFDLRLGGEKVQLKRDEAEQLLQSLFDGMKALIDKVPLAARRHILLHVEAGNGRITVRDIYPHFQRDTLEHLYLRGLRDAQFIRPIDRGPFHSDSVLEMKTFGRVMLRYQREYVFS